MTTNSQYCSNITAPINISHDTKICESTCKFKPEYENSKIICQNMNTYILIQINASDKAPITNFNDNVYKVEEIRIFNKSIHTYLGKYAEGEILIIHKNTTKSNEILIVSIPIIKSSVSTAGTNMLEAIIEATYVQAPLTSLSKSNSTGSDKISQPFIPNVKFDIKYLIPSSPYYFYKGIFGFQNSLGGCGNESNILVYSPQEGHVSITNEMYTTFQEVINPPSQIEYPISSGPVLYYNSKGPIGEHEDIYIDCQPVNQSTDKVYVPLQDQSKDFQDLYNEIEKAGQGPLAGGVLGILLVLGLYFIFDNSFKLFKGIKPGPLSVEAINS